jgi:hypothetical protein
MQNSTVVAVDVAKAIFEVAVSDILVRTSVRMTALGAAYEGDGAASCRWPRRHEVPWRGTAVAIQASWFVKTW